MIKMSEIPMPLAIILAIIILISTVLAIYSVVTDMILQNKHIKLLASICTIILHWLLLRYIDEIIHYLNSTNTFTCFMHGLYKINLLTFIIVLLFTMVLSAYLHVDSIHFRRHCLTSLSVKYVLDSLPLGLLFYLPNGTILLYNKAANDFVYKFTGKGLLNTRVLINDIKNGKILDNEIIFHQGFDAIVRIKNEIYSININDTTYYNKKIHRLTITNITKEYNMTQELKENLIKLKKYNQELKIYNQNIIESTKNEEILNTKIKVHDKLGELLLEAKRLDENSSYAEKRDYLDNAIETLSLLISKDDVSKANDDLEDILKAAEAIGVNVNIDGIIPDNNIFYTALHECITNTYKHGHGNIVNVKSYNNRFFDIIEVTNNGIVPEKISLNGGLSTLSNLCKSHGGYLEITNDGIYKLVCALAKEEIK